MKNTYLHKHSDFATLLQIIGRRDKISPFLIEKDYWLMHVLYGLKKQGFQFALKGGTSLSKGFQIIDRFSEDIDIQIEPPKQFKINPNPKNNKANNIQARKDFYDWLAGEIRIDGITDIQRDIEFDDQASYRSGGIRLFYTNSTEKIEGIKDGILLEAGFSKVTPNVPLTISSWAYQTAIESSISINDNRAIDIPCYNQGYTLVEKLQTIVTKFRQERADGIPRKNLMRQYYDVYCLLGTPEVELFLSTKDYNEHKKYHFPSVDLVVPLQENEAFLLSDPQVRGDLKRRYERSASLYYNGQPGFDLIIERIGKYIAKF